MVADARDPIALRDAVAATGGPADVTVVCVDVPGCEGGAILATAERGTVIFFSMATSFSAAALGAEGLAADVTMLVGNGYVPGHAAYAMDLLRRTTACAASSSGGCDGTHPTRQARPRPGHRPPGTVAGPQGRPADRAHRPAAHHRLRRARHPAAGRPRGRRRRGHALGQPAGRRVRADVGLEHGVALPVWDALRRGEGADLRELAQKASAGSVTFRLPEGQDAKRPAPPRRGPSVQASSASTHAAASASA